MKVLSYAAMGELIIMGKKIVTRAARPCFAAKTLLSCIEILKGYDAVEAMPWKQRTISRRIADPV